MRPLVLIGLALIVIGGVLFYTDGSFSTSKQVLAVGDVKITTRAEHRAPKWVAGLVALTGLGLVAAGAGRGSRS